MDLFNASQTPSSPEAVPLPTAPLSTRMRPRTLDEIVGQDHLLAKDCLLRRAISADRFNSLIFYGPPGCGKTSLAEVIAKTTSRRFERASGVLSNVPALRKLLEEALHRKKMEKRQTVLFIDEIHRFNKAQQDVLLPYVEAGDISLIGATTHNPCYFINAPLNSRSQLFQLEPLNEEALRVLIIRAIESPLGFSNQANISDEALTFLSQNCEGDARLALNALEIAILTTPEDPSTQKKQIGIETIEASLQKRAIRYDKNEDEHYDTISAFIKSVRGSDPDAAIYWLAKMLIAGEDPRFIARRLVILASEDIGNADPRGLSLAVAAMQAAEFIGMPEARIPLAQATTYLASAPKSNAAYLAINAAMKDLEKGGIQVVPDHLQSGSKIKPASQTYAYPHNHDNHYVDQAYMAEQKKYYHPTNQGFEARIKQQLESISEPNAQNE